MTSLTGVSFTYRNDRNLIWYYKDFDDVLSEFVEFKNTFVHFDLAFRSYVLFNIFLVTFCNLFLDDSKNY